MEKWKIVSEIDSDMSGMDISQISELATAIMESWSSSPPPPGTAPQLPTLLQPQEQQKVFIKQEQFDYPMHQQEREQVPMDDLLDPLESFSFWEAENNFYREGGMSVDMPPLPEYLLDDDMSRDDDEDMLLPGRNPTLAELNSSEFSSSCFPDDFPPDSNLAGLSRSFPAVDSHADPAGLSRSFPAVGLESHFVHSPPVQQPGSSCFGLNYVPSGYIDIKQNVQPSLSSSCPAQGQFLQPLVSDAVDSHPDSLAGLSRSFPDVGGLDSHFVHSPPVQQPSSCFGLNYVPSGYIDIKQNVQPSLSSSCPAQGQFLQGGQFLMDKFPICPQNSPASDSYFVTTSGGKIVDRQVASPSRVPSSSPLRVAQSNRFHQQQEILSSSAPSEVTSYFRSKVKSEPLSSSPGPRSITERSLSGFSSLSLSNDDESGSFFDDEEDEDDFSSDEDVYQYESDDTPTDKSAPRKHRFFWQYNLQSRGAKSTHILPRGGLPPDPHAPQAPFDPVFHEECALPVKHSGKARRGDGNDLTPDPRKLHAIGVELRGLNRIIYCGQDAKPLSRKEKNKLASRVCRLKKKAQHEANKIKLYGLQQEHKKLLHILVDTRELLKYKIENLDDKKVSNCSKKLETFLAANDPYKVAGNTATFVNEVLEKVSKGEPDGGLGRL